VKIWPIFKKGDCGSTFTSPVAWVIMAVFPVHPPAILLFDLQLLRGRVVDAVGHENPMGRRPERDRRRAAARCSRNFSVILLLMMPLITMRLFAEERRSGTIELLADLSRAWTAPCCLAKFLAAFPPSTR